VRETRQNTHRVRGHTSGRELVVSCVVVTHPCSLGETRRGPEPSRALLVGGGCSGLPFRVEGLLGKPLHRVLLCGQLLLEGHVGT
jgi:hypothetical protein